MSDNIKHWYDITQKESKRIFSRVLNQHVKLSITGLSQSGKSTFITSLINQLLNCSPTCPIPFFKLSDEDRIIAVKIEPLDDLAILPFPYDDGINALRNNRWPESTKTCSGIRLKIKYQSKGFWIGKVISSSVIIVDIYDYPGEWLADVQMLSQDFYEWSKNVISTLSQYKENCNDYEKSLISSFFELIEKPKSFDKEWFKQCVQSFHSLSVINQKCLGAIPGRFILPGELLGTPSLEFFPLPKDTVGFDEQNEYLDQLISHFRFYKEKIVRPFFDQYFSNIDRQIVLVDCVDLVREKKTNISSMIKTLSSLSNILAYGQQNIITRLWKPKIDKVIFAATKADQIPKDQQYSLQSFLHSMFRDIEKRIKFEESNVIFQTIASTKSAESVTVKKNEKVIHCIKGVEAQSNEEVIVYPGLFPIDVMELENRSVDYDLPRFNPPIVEKSTSPSIPHIRMGKVLEFLIGDLLL